MNYVWRRSFLSLYFSNKVTVRNKTCYPINHIPHFLYIQNDLKKKKIGPVGVPDNKFSLLLNPGV